MADEAVLNNVGRGADLANDEIDLGEYLATLIEARWLIGAITGIVLLVGVAYVLLATPVYRSDALLQVEEQSASLGGLEDISSMFGGETPAEAEIEILRSRAVIGAAVDQLRLDVEVEPRRFPLVGGAVARRHSEDEGPAAPVWGLARYAWGGERIQVPRLDVPRAYLDEPMTLVAGEGGRFKLYGPEDELLLKGEVGAAADSPGGAVAIFVSELVANPGTEFRLTKRPRIEVIGDLQEKLKVSEKGKKSGILQVALEGIGPERLAETIGAITNIYLRQNVERRSAEAEQTLAFLNTQLPALKADLQAAEARLNDYQSRRGSIDLSLETEAVLAKLAEVEKALSELELKKEELWQKFTANHPVIVTLNRKRSELEAQRANLNGQIKAMPEEVQEAVRLSRDTKVANELYMLLLNKAQEMRVIKAGTIGNVRIVDSALVPVKPEKPKKGLVVALALMLGLMAGVVVAFVRKSLNKGIEDPDLLEQQTGLPVYASVPHSDAQAKLAKGRKQAGQYGGLLARLDHDDLAIESLRSLRTSLQFALMDARNNIVSITGPSPGIGKSFLSANLAGVLAEAGKRTLLIDADMRKGHLHEYFGMKRTNGLSGVISGEVERAEAIRKGVIENLDFLPAGIVPPNPAELLMSRRFQEMLERCSEDYDLVIVDTPPVLAVTDSAIVGRLVGINFVLLRAGVHPLREVEQTLKRLRQNGVNPQGFVFNDLPLRAGRYHNYRYHYQYSYKQ